MVEVAFAIAGIIVILGFIGNYLFKRTGVPDILLLILFGFILGPVSKVIEPAILSPIAPYFASLALLVILFEGGLNLNLHRAIKESPRAMFLSVLGFSMSLFLTVIFTYFVWGWDIMTGLLLGTIVGGTSSSVVIPLVSRMKTTPRIATLLSLESVFTDAIILVVGLTLLNLMVSTPAGDSLMLGAHDIASAFSIAAVIGIISGIVWLNVLKHIKGETYDDILTLSIVFLLYALVETLRGNGAIFALTFGLVLGNGKEVGKIFNIKETVEAGKITKKFMSQMSFFIRTYFFVYLGLIVLIQDYSLVLYGFLLSLLLLLARFIAVTLISERECNLNKYKAILVSMVPRGLAAAVLAQIVLTSGVEHASMFPDMIIVIIISTVAFSGVGTWLIEKGYFESKLVCD